MFDAQVVLTPKSSPRGKLLSEYICARIPSMTGIDIGLFDFDRHNTLFYFIMNADEQIYMRYGGRDAASSGSYLDLNSLEVALKLGLEQHELYKQGRLVKQGRPAALFPSEIPLLKRNVIDRRRCVECHLIGDYQVQELELAGKLNRLEDLFVYPDIKTIGIHLDVPLGLIVKQTEGAVKESGMEPGDLIISINGTPVLTFADLQHIYNKVARDSKQVRISVNRNGAAKELLVDLPDEWWYTDLYHRLWSIDPVLFIVSKPLTDEEKREFNLDVTGFACRITTVYLEARRMRLHDLQPGDIVYSVDGVKSDELTTNFETHIKLHKKSGIYITVKLLRNGEEMDMRIKTGRLNFRKR